MTIDSQDNLRLHHIVEATRYIVDFMDGVSKESFEDDYEKQSAVIRQFEIIGEAASKLKDNITDHYKEIDWPKVVGMRHKMIHDYFDIDVNIVFTTAIDDAPRLKKAIEKILESR